MDSTLHIDQELQQTQRLSPQQVQFVRMLEMNTPEIEDEVRRQLDENPALEAAETFHDTTADDADGKRFNESAEQLQRADYRSDEDAPSYPRAYESASAQADIPVAADGPTLLESLRTQIGELDLDGATRQVALYIAGNIEANGYLSRSLSDIADDIAFITGIDVPRSMLHAAFDAVRSLDPPGVGAVDLRDCLLLQLRRREPKTLTTRIAIEIVDKYFDLFTKLHFDRIQSRLELQDDTEFRRAIALIRSLDPKPGHGAESESASDRLRHITPDFAVECDDNGRCTVTALNRLPQLQIESSFDINSDTPGRNPAQREAMAFIRLRRDEAESFIAMLRRRGDTLMAVMNAIVRLQPDFFRTGREADIRPMILRDIAGITGLELSVISRAMAGKYVATESGVYPLRMFLNERPKDDTDASSHAIADALRSLIAEEDPRAPLSDQALTEAMNAKGFDLARRTVAKYRERLGLPVARLRKKT